MYFVRNISDTFVQQKKSVYDELFFKHLSKLVENKEPSLLVGAKTQYRIGICTNSVGYLLALAAFVGSRSV